MKRNIVIPVAAVTAVLLLVISGVRESRYTYETQPGGCVQVQGGGFAGRQYPGGMSMGTGTGGGLLAGDAALIAETAPMRAADMRDKQGSFPTGPSR